MGHRRGVIIAWIVAALGITMISASVGTKNSTDFTLAGTQSASAQALLKQSFKAQAAIRSCSTHELGRCRRIAP